MKPDWKDAPPWAQWLAQDSDGRWCWFSDEPEDDECSWIRGYCANNWPGPGYARYTTAGKGTPNPNWRDTLERRPDAVRENGWLAKQVAESERNIELRDTSRTMRLERERARLIEALRPLALEAGNYDSTAPESPLIESDLTMADAYHARELLRELGEWPEVRATPPTAKDFNDALARDLAALAHEPSRDELEADEGEPWWRIENAAASDDGKTFTADIVLTGAPLNLPDLFPRQQGKTAKAEQLLRRIGCPADIHPRARCGECGGAGKHGLTRLLSMHCRECNATGRQHRNGKPFYCAEEVALYVRGVTP